MEDRLNIILDQLKEKAVTKQEVYRDTLSFFEKTKKLAEEITLELAAKMKEVDEHVIVEFRDIGQFEFQVKFSADLLVFSMHSNTVIFPTEHVINKSPYILEDPSRRFFGAITVYNFLDDSLKYKRMNDPGYLVGRMFTNKDAHFYFEGVKQLNFLYPDVAQNKLSDGTIKVFVESCMMAALEIDSSMPPFEKEKVISVGYKLSQSMLGNVQKVGFKMSDS